MNDRPIRWFTKFLHMLIFKIFNFYPISQKYYWIKMSIECSKAVQGFLSKSPHAGACVLAFWTLSGQ